MLFNITLCDPALAPPEILTINGIAWSHIGSDMPSIKGVVVTLKDVSIVSLTGGVGVAVGVAVGVVAGWSNELTGKNLSLISTILLNPSPSESRCSIAVKPFINSVAV